MKKIITILATIFLPFMVIGQSLTITYEYDELNRLVKVDYPNGQRVEYAYDALGNRISRTVSQLLAVQVNITPQGAGTVSGVGNYEPETLVTLEATANEGHTFANWMQGEQVITTEPTYSFTITQPETFVANFTVNSYTITASANPTEGGTVNGAGTYEYGSTVTLTALVNDGYAFVNWTKDGEEVSTEQTYTFTVTEDADFVANYELIGMTQETGLVAGTNWFSTFLEITLDDLKAALVEALPNANNITIKSQRSGQTMFNGDRWRGALNTLDVALMYQITVPESCEITLEGLTVDPAMHPVTIKNGPNWIAFPFNVSMTPTETFGNFPVSGDRIQSKSNGQANYTNRWRGALSTLMPGQGYIYISTATEDRTFTFPTSAK